MQALNVLAANKGLALGLLIVGIILVAAVFAPQIAPNLPHKQDLRHKLATPSAKHPLGADYLGRCLASRLLYGARTSMGLALAITLATSVFGMAVGILAGIFPRLDFPLMRITDCFFAFPTMVAALLCVTLTGPGIFGIILALSIPGWPKYSRVARVVAQRIMHEPHVETVRSMGAGKWYVVRTCILGEVWPQMATIATIGVGSKIAAIAGLGFLGLGIQPPTPEWGLMMSKGLPALSTAPHVSLLCGTCIAVSVLGFVLTGEGLRDYFDHGRVHEGALQDPVLQKTA